MYMSQYRRAAAVLCATALCALAILPGCGGKPDVRIKDAPAETMRQATRDELLATLDLRFGGLESLLATASGFLIWEAIDPEAGEVMMESQDIGRASLLFRRAQDTSMNVRIVGAAAEREGSAFSLLGRDGEFWLRLPWAPNRVFVGSIDPTVKRPGVNSTIRPQDISTLLFFNDVVPIERNTRYISYLETWPKIYILHILRTDRFPGEIVHSRIWFDRTNLAVVAHQLFDSDGSVIAEARFANFTTMPLARDPRGGDAARESVMIPGEIFLFWPKDRVVLNVQIRPGQVNRPIDDKSFAPPDPTRIQYFNINTAPPR